LVSRSQEAVSLRTLDGATALHMAVAGDHLEVAKYLAEHGADVNARNGGCRQLVLTQQGAAHLLSPLLLLRGV